LALTVGLAPWHTSHQTTLSSINNALLQLRSGAQITASEANRIGAELPSYKDPAPVFEQKLKTARELAANILNSKAQALREAGHQNVPTVRPPGPPPAVDPSVQREIDEYLRGGR